MKIFGLAVVVAAVLLPMSAFGDGFSITISVDENCNGNITTSLGANSSLTCDLQTDPGPGGLSSALTYGLFDPPGLTAGDLILTEAGSEVASDIIRFNPTETIAESTGALVFYSDTDDGVDAMADTGLPTALYTNDLTVSEVGTEGSDGYIYTPTEGQPGFVAGASGPVTYVIQSDGSTVPEPASIGMVLAGIGVLFGKHLRRLRAQKS